MIWQGFTIWFTGLPCSGKSTLAQSLYRHLTDRQYPTEILDGDDMRKRLTIDLDFSKEGRDENIRRISFVAKLVSRVGGVAITATISPYEAMRLEARREIKNFIEVYVDCPLEVCMKRDVKGHYAKAQQGLIANFTGISDPYEPPKNPEITVQTHLETPEDSLKTIIAYIEKSGFLHRL